MTLQYPSHFLRLLKSSFIVSIRLCYNIGVQTETKLESIQDIFSRSLKKSHILNTVVIIQSSENYVRRIEYHVRTHLTTELYLTILSLKTVLIISVAMLQLENRYEIRTKHICNHSPLGVHKKFQQTLPYTCTEQKRENLLGI